MIAIISIISLVALISLYDYFTARRWQQVTSTQRNSLVFENRNRAYGAYVIRRNYDKIVVIIMGAVVLAIALAYITWRIVSAIPEEPEPEVPIDMTQFTMAAPPEEEVPPPPPEEPVPPMEKTIQFIPPVVVDEIVDNTPPIQEDMEKTKASTETNETENENWEVQEPVKQQVVEEKKEEILVDVDEYAEFPGGASALRNFLAQNLKYPQTAIDQELEGKCYLRFVVSTDGRISDVTVIRPVPDCPECDREAVRVIRAMPRWKPAKNAGRTVNSYYNIPINFELE